MAVGYDSSKGIEDCTGALLIRNSWGPEWGDKGYGWLPYAYVEAGLAVDFWSLVRADFVDTDLFK
jgi:C1A family cysteine protease